jgi:soluble lytic murein transglycosylase-like protein/outer membrane protein assembly factor BamD (BamD/ComL family)
VAAPAHARFLPSALRDKRVLYPAAAVALVALFFLGRSPGTVLREAASPDPEDAAVADSPMEAWTDLFVRLEQAKEWSALARELSAIQRRHPDPYERYRLGYLHARAALEAGDEDEAAAALAPFLAAGHPFRDLALYHAARLAERGGKPEEASRLRGELIARYPQATHRARAIEDETAYLAAKGDAARLSALAAQVTASVDAAALRDIEARVVEAQVSEDPAAATARGVRLLKAGIADDAAERVSQALDRPEVLAKLPPGDRVLVGEAARSHRRFDRAVEILEAAKLLLPARRDELAFSIGRARFGQERYEEAEKIYLAGAAASADAEQKAVFFFHASRCAQLLGDDARAERHMAGAIAVGGTFPKTSAAITQRLRTRLKQGRVAEASGDLRLLRQRFPKDHALVEGSLAYATAMIAAGSPADALRGMDRVPRRLLQKQDVPEAEYWRGRARETTDPRAAGYHYLAVLRADAPSHFASFARKRLAEPAVAAAVRKEQAARAAQVQSLLASGEAEAARGFQTDLVLLAAPSEQAKETERLAEIYRRLPRFAEVLDLRAPEFPRLPLTEAAGPTAVASPPANASPTPASPAPATPAPSGPDRLDNLLALGLFDDAVDLIRERYPLQPAASAVARAVALSRAGATRASIQSIEIAARAFPPDFLPRLLPRVVSELLYPRYFEEEIVRQSAAHGADPRLVRSIMREESRFEPRARSAASARGLLQLITTTAREVGKALGLVDVSSEDLYDPAVAIRIGARYVADLQREFGGDPYATAAAYNAGPNQARLWARLAPGPGHDYFLSSVNFDETKDYVRKVMNSYERYTELYGAD